MGHPAWDIPRPARKPVCPCSPNGPRDSQFKHAETPEGLPASRLGLSVACSHTGPLGAETLEGHPASQSRMQPQSPARCGDP
eukprot:365548-Chlamydomonas_euryale.AAC.3